MPASQDLDQLGLSLENMLSATRTSWHDIGQHLTVIMAEAQFLHRSYQNTPELQDGLERISQATESISQKLKMLYQAQVAISNQALDKQV